MCVRCKQVKAEQGALCKACCDDMEQLTRMERAAANEQLRAELQAAKATVPTSKPQRTEWREAV